MYLSLVLFCTALVCALTWEWLVTRRARKCFKHLPSFPTLPILGHTYKFLRNGPEGFLNFILEISEKADETGLPVPFYPGPYPLLFCSNIDDVRILSYSCLEKTYYYKFSKILFGNSLLTAPGSMWKRTIKKLGGVFSRTVVNSYQNVFSTHGKILADKFRSKIDAPPFDMTEDLSQVTFEAICHTALGAPQDNENIDFSAYLRAFDKLLASFLKRGLNPITHMERIYKLTPGYKKAMEYMKIINDTYMSVLRKVESKEYKQKQQEDTSESPKKFKSYLDILLKLKESDPIFTPEQIRFEVNTIIVAGQDTSATSLFFILLNLGARPEIQEKLYEELYEIFGDSDRLVETEDLDRMKYCEAVVMETLRLYPPITMISRCTDKDVQLKSCLVPKGTDFAINIIGAGRSRRAWGPDALEFKPERWLNPDLDTSSFFVFGHGRRTCIGKKYAIALEKTMLATLVREFRFTANIEGMRMKAEIPLRAITCNLIQVHARKPSRVQIKS